MLCPQGLAASFFALFPGSFPLTPSGTAATIAWVLPPGGVVMLIDLSQIDFEKHLVDQGGIEPGDPIPDRVCGLCHPAHKPDKQE